MSEIEFSIIVAVRNEKEYIERCIESLFNQDFDGKYEVIVVDGMSDDGTYEILQELQRKYNFVLLRNPKINAAAGFLASKRYLREWIQTEWVAPIYFQRMLHLNPEP